MFKGKFNLTCCAIVLSQVVAVGQDSLSLIISSREEGFEDIVREAGRYNGQFDSESKLLRQIEAMTKALRSTGYLEASCDSIVRKGNHFTAWMHVGHLYTWLRLSPGNIDRVWLREINYRERLFTGKPVRIESVRALQERILHVAENHGYPFARVSLDSITMDSSGVGAALMFDKERLVKIDTIVIHGDAGIHAQYLSNYLGIAIGDPYSETLCAGISRRLRELPFVKVTRSPEVLFVPDGARIDLFLELRQVSRFNLLIGVLPNSESNEGKLLLTADADLDLRNSLGIGEQFKLRWKNLNPRSPELHVQLVYPYVAWLPVGADAMLQLYKNDSLYLNLKMEAGLRFSLMGYNYFRFLFRRESSSLITVDTQSVRMTHALPKFLDWSAHVGGMEFHREQLDYRFNPRKGWSVTAGVEVNARRVLPNTQIRLLTDPSDPTFDFATLYDSLDAPVLRLGVHAEATGFLPLGKRMTMMSSVSAASLRPQTALFSNEMYRLGGHNFVRGFDEEQFLGTSMLRLILEWRYLLATNSFFRVFSDGGFLVNASEPSDTGAWPVGIGFGLAMETKAGVFGVNYALGRLLNEPEGFRFRNAKVHFGYLAFF